MSGPLNLTDKRLECLRYLARKKNPVYVSALADAVVPRGSRYGYTAQMATRTGAGVAWPLIRAGLVSRRSTEYGWGTVAITDAGLEVLAAFDRDDGTLEAALERARAMM